MSKLQYTYTKDVIVDLIFFFSINSTGKDKIIKKMLTLNAAVKKLIFPVMDVFP